MDRVNVRLADEVAVEAGLAGARSNSRLGSGHIPLENF